MQFLPLTQSVIPLAGVAGPPSIGLQDIENYAESATDQVGLFAQILSQLDIGYPLEAPVAPAAGTVTADAPARIAVHEFPVAGKTLPLSPATGGQTLPPAVLEVAARGIDPDRQSLQSPALPPVLKRFDSLTPPTTPMTGLSATTARPSGPTPEQPPVVVTPDARTPTVTLQPATPKTATPMPAEWQTTLLLAPETPEPVLPQQFVSAPNASVSASFNPTPAMPTPAPGNVAQHAYALNQPVADPQWGNELGQRLLWMNEHGIGRAELRMNPPELGPVEVRIAVSNDDARVAFQVQHAATREALENAMPRLRELFASQGLNLDDASVSHHTAQDQPRSRGGDDREPDAESGLHGPAGELADAPDEVRATPLDGLIDTYV